MAGNKTVSDAVATVIHALKTDEGYRQGWKANIAMSFLDEYKNAVIHGSEKTLHQIANDAADRFLEMLCR